jgi:hypothetical protein
MRNVLAALFLAGVPLLAQTPCDCIDKEDIKVRMKRDTAAINAYGKEIVTTGMDPYTTPGRIALQKRVDAAMSASNTPGRIPLEASAATSNSCDIEIFGHPTKCLEAALRAHEKIHQDACRATYDKHHVIFRRKAMDRFEALGMTMAGYMMEELQGYQAELMFLAGELNRLERECQPPPSPGRDYSSRDNSGSGPGNPPPATTRYDPSKPKAITPPPMVKPKPLPVPKPID